jgi:PTH1 family peptidyl-tRNA hydrolase
MSFFRRARRRGGDSDSERWAVVGLGNPGPRYEGTRHNVGVIALKELLDRTGARLKSHKSGCVVAETRLAGESAVLARPTSFMNESGRPVASLVRYYKVSIERLIVIHDEIDIPFGEVRVKLGGGTAGHNGLNSIVRHLGKEFVRIRVGVGRPRGRREAADHVLAEFSSAERKELPYVVDRAADAAEAVITRGVERAMNEVNTRSTEPR